MASPIVRFKRLPQGDGLPLPSYASEGASGIDLYSAETAIVRFGEPVRLRSGFAVEVQPGYEGQVRGRSGLAFNSHVSITHGVGTIDSDYRGEIMITLAMHAQTDPITIHRGMRVAQLVISPVARADVMEVGELSGSARGEKGLGSTGA